MIPTAGGECHWVCLLAPSKSKTAMSYVTGKFPNPGSNQKSAEE